MSKVRLINSKSCGKDNFHFNTTDFQDDPKSQYTSKVLGEVTPELYVSIWRSSSATFTVQPNWKILPRYCDTTSACQKCSATVFCIGNWLWSIFPAIFLNGCKSLEKSTFFYPHLHAASSPSSEQAAAHHPCSLKAIIISFPFPAKASASPTFEQIPWCGR